METQIYTSNVIHAKKTSKKYNKIKHIFRIKKTKTMKSVKKIYFK